MKREYGCWCVLLPSRRATQIAHFNFLFQANINLKIIMQRTKTTILFPDASDPNIPPIRKGSVTVTGMINNVYLVSML